MMCFDDPSDIQLYGEPVDMSASTVMLEINKCLGKDYCKNEEEIDQFLADKRLVIIYNQQNFNSATYGDDSIKLSTQIDYIKLKAERQTIAIETQLIDSDEFILNPGWFSS